MGNAVKVSVKGKELEKLYAELWIPKEAALEQVHCMMQILLKLDVRNS